MHSLVTECDISVQRCGGTIQRHSGLLNGGLMCAAINLFLPAAVMLPSTTFFSRLVMARLMMALRWHASEYFILCCAWCQLNCKGESVLLSGSLRLDRAPTNFLAPYGLTSSVLGQVLCVFHLSPHILCQSAVPSCPLDLLSSVSCS